MTYYVMFEAGTERPFKNEFHNFKGKGTYVSAATGVPLSYLSSLLNSGTGWPSFTKPIDEKAVIVRDDPDGSGRLEVLDASSGGHLGHVFDDGPPPTGKRYCMNSAAMKFVPAAKEK
jgi:peptide-methionine (R)-S-oxide reductase